MNCDTGITAIPERRKCRGKCEITWLSPTYMFGRWGEKNSPVV
jgi:hypothetical protein